MIANIFRDLGRCGTPLALIAMGGLFNFASVSENTRDITAGCLVRLVIIPALLIPLAVWLGFRGSELVALMCIFFAPCATSSFNLACAMDSDADLTSQLIVFHFIVLAGYDIPLDLHSQFFWFTLTTNAKLVLILCDSYHIMHKNIAQIITHESMISHATI